MADRVASTLVELGANRAMVFFGHDGLDELTTSDSSTVLDVRDGVVTSSMIDPLEFGLARASRDDLRGGDAAASAEIVRAILGGETGPRRDVVLLNVSAALQVAGFADSWTAGIERAAAAIDDGSAREKLEHWIATSQRVMTGAV